LTSVDTLEKTLSLIKEELRWRDANHYNARLKISGIGSHIHMKNLKRDDVIALVKWVQLCGVHFNCCELRVAGGSYWSDWIFDFVPLANGKCDLYS